MTRDPRWMEGDPIALDEDKIVNEEDIKIERMWDDE